MNTKMSCSYAALVLGSIAAPAVAQEGTVTGAAGGAVTGAIVGGPVGAAVGGVVGAIAGTAVAPPPTQVVTYVRQQPVPTETVVIEQPIVVGKPIPETVVLTPVRRRTRPMPTPWSTTSASSSIRRPTWSFRSSSNILT